ncbi:S8 family peptidase [Paenibacillus cymbidii]|uniref:S8 family peptidase n=1 Tax=Paenibacillus cymbidii TaxID=1639034 RepID=UPI001F373E56|nr:S8 family peptidase [Paenibacillus cymbidii]
MNDEPLLQAIVRETAAASDSTKRYIIRFASAEHYERFVSGIGTVCPAQAAAAVTPLPLIHAVSCRLRSAAAVKAAGASCIAYIEADDRPAYVSMLHGATARRKPVRPRTPKPAIPWGVGQIRAPEAWPLSTGSRVKVGVIDTGIDYHHPNLRDSFEGGINLVHPHLPPLDDNGHGTHISGTIAAAAKRSGIVGVAPHASIHAVKAFDHNGSAYVSDIVSGIYWCVRNRIRVINMSFGMKKKSGALEDAVRSAYHAGMIVVASSGNDGKRSGIDFPASCPLAVSVGATTKRSRIASFSNRGRAIDIFAPGEKIYSTWLNGNYHVLSGTSMATSHVSGVIALMLAAKPELTPRQIKWLLKRHASLMTVRNELQVAYEANAYRTLLALSRIKS